VRAHITPNSACLAVSTQRRIRALYISTKEPYVYPQESPTYIHKQIHVYKEPCIYPPKSPTHIRQRALYISTKIPEHIRKRVLYMSVNEPYISPQKSPAHIHKRALYISSKDPYTSSCLAAIAQRCLFPAPVFTLLVCFFFLLEHTGWRHTSHRWQKVVHLLCSTQETNALEDREALQQKRAVALALRRSSHGTRIYESWHTCTGVMPHGRKWRAIRYGRCHVAHVQTSHGTRAHESWHTCTGVIPHGRKWRAIRYGRCHVAHVQTSHGTSEHES